MVKPKPKKLSKAAVAYDAARVRYRKTCELKDLLTIDLNRCWGALSTKERDERLEGGQ